MCDEHILWGDKRRTVVYSLDETVQWSQDGCFLVMHCHRVPPNLHLAAHVEIALVEVATYREEHPANTTVRQPVCFPQRIKGRSALTRRIVAPQLIEDRLEYDAERKMIFLPGTPERR
jgi:hypothetical protein